MEYPVATKNRDVDICLFTWENFRVYCPLEKEKQERERKLRKSMLQNVNSGYF